MEAARSQAKSYSFTGLMFQRIKFKTERTAINYREKEGSLEGKIHKSVYKFPSNL